jgi:hypothetical protein
MSIDIPTAPIIKFRKNSESSVTKDRKSVMILETKEKKITVNLKDDKVFLNKKDFPKNIELMKSSISNIEKHSSDRSLVRIQNIKGDALDGLEIEKKIIPERANRSVIRSQEEKAGELSKDKD